MIMVFYGLKALPYSCKYPILLNRDSYLTELIILKCHLFVLHSGVKDTLNELRSNYWVTRERQTVKSVIRKCLKCIRQSSRPFDVLPAAPLPRFRVDIDFPYSHTGDNPYLGPFYVKNIYGSKTGIYTNVILWFILVQDQGSKFRHCTRCKLSVIYSKFEKIY